MRIRYRALVQELFFANFMRPVVAWCREHGVLYTGHLSGDEGPLACPVNEPGAAMPFQRCDGPGG